MGMGRGTEDEVKALLPSDHLLVHYDRTNELILACDAYMYSQLEKRVSRSSFAVKRFHQYLFGRHFGILSDHKTLRGLLKATSETAIMASACIQH